MSAVLYTRCSRVLPALRGNLFPTPRPWASGLTSPTLSDRWRYLSSTPYSIKQEYVVHLRISMER